MKWGNYKKIFEKHGLKEGNMSLIYFDSCSRNSSNYIFGLKITFNKEFMYLEWEKKYSDLAIEIIERELSEDFDQLDYFIFEEKTYTKLNEEVVNTIISSLCCKCKIYGKPQNLIDTSMWVRYLEDPIDPSNNLTDELKRQKETKFN